MRLLFEATVSLFIMSAVVIICFATLWEPVFQINDALRSNQMNITSRLNTSGATQLMKDEVNRATYRTEWALMAVPVIMIGGTALWYMLFASREEKGRF